MLGFTGHMQRRSVSADLKNAAWYFSYRVPAELPILEIVIGSVSFPPVYPARIYAAVELPAASISIIPASIYAL